MATRTPPGKKKAPAKKATKAKATKATKAAKVPKVTKAAAAAVAERAPAREAGQGTGPRAQGRRPHAGDRGVAHQGAHHPRVPAGRVPGGGVDGPRARPARRREGDSRQVQGARVVAARRQRRQRLRAAVHRAVRQEGDRARTEGRARRVRPADPRDRRRPRGREHLLAPARAAAAEGAGEAHGVPRDHPRGDPGRAGAHARRGRPAGAGAGNAAHPRPAGGLHPLAAALEEDRVGPLGGPGAVGRHAPAGGARARAPRLPRRPPTGTWWRSCGTPGRGSRRS